MSACSCSSEPAHINPPRICIAFTIHPLCLSCRQHRSCSLSVCPCVVLRCCTTVSTHVYGWVREQGRSGVDNFACVRLRKQQQIGAGQAATKHRHGVSSFVACSEAKCCSSARAFTYHVVGWVGVVGVCHSTTGTMGVSGLGLVLLPRRKHHHERQPTSPRPGKNVARPAATLCGFPAWRKLLKTTRRRCSHGYVP